MPEKEETEPFARKHAALVDKGDQTSRLLTALLEEMEFGSIMCLPSVQALFDIIPHRKLDLLIVDLDRDEYGGESFFHRALELDPDLAIVVVSSYASIDSSVALMKIGVSDVIRKPFDLGTVKAKLTAQVRSKTMRKTEESDLTIGPYVVIREIERGGMGIIYQARDTKTGRTIALKVLKTGRNAPIEHVLRFHREASTISRLVHPYIVSIENTGFSGDDYYIAMDFVDGSSLDEAVYEGMLTTDETVDIVIKCIEAVQYAHNMNIIHRDLKPPNILIDKKKNPHIIDFGLATFVKGNVKLTRTGIVMGTIGYIAPERIRGGPVDERVDIFSLGAILYESLTKKIPYETDSRVISVPTTYDDLVPIRSIKLDVTPELDQVCAKALSVDPELRYTSAAAFHKALVQARLGMQT